MKNDSLIKETFGDHTFNKYIEAKSLEWEEYRKIVTPWEYKKYI